MQASRVWSVLSSSGHLSSSGSVLVSGHLQITSHTRGSGRVRLAKYLIYSDY